MIMEDGGWRSRYSKALRCTFLGPEKIHVAQILCNLSYVIVGEQDHQKIVQLKVYPTQICVPQVSLDPISICKACVA